jgi:type IV pilus assembly protein PilM
MRKSFFDHFPPPAFLDLPFVALDISSKAVRILELKHRNGQTEVGRFGERLLTTPFEVDTMASNEELKKVLQSLQREFRLHYVKATLPEEEAYLFKTEVEEGSLQAMRTSIEFHLEENVPISGEEALFDFHIYKKKDQAHYDSSVTVLPKKTVESYTSLFLECNLEPLSFLLEPTAISRAVVKGDDTGAYIIANLGEVKTGISIVSDQAIQFTSTVNIGSESFTSAISKEFNVTAEDADKMKKEKGLVRQSENSDIFFALANSVSVLKDEIERVFMYWHSQQENTGAATKKIEKVILCGKDSTLLGFRDHLALNLKIPVEIANVWGNLFSFDETIPPISQADSLNYAACVGLLLPKTK